MWLTSVLNWDFPTYERAPPPLSYKKRADRRGRDPELARSARASKKEGLLMYIWAQLTCTTGVTRATKGASSHLPLSCVHRCIYIYIYISSSGEWFLGRRLSDRNGHCGCIFEQHVGRNVTQHGQERVRRCTWGGRTGLKKVRRPRRLLRAPNLPTNERQILTHTHTSTHAHAYFSRFLGFAGELSFVEVMRGYNSLSCWTDHISLLFRQPPNLSSSFFKLARNT